MKKIIYRSDIDSLRAIAVIAVMIFHIDREILSGGFVGVDIFFVISGYLITSIILKDVEENNFSLVKFYDRRIRRILPALLFFLMASSIASYIVLFPSDLFNYAKSLISSLAFISNIYFWRSSGYFSPAADTIPLLHTWSLSIEEQFYLLFPISILILGYLFKENKIKAIVISLGVIFIFSFFLSIWGVENKPLASFYLLPTRAWELLLGSLLAFFPSIKLNIIYRGVLSGAGVLLIVFSFFYLNKDISFPGKNALFPCVGASLFIFSNHKVINKNYISHVLSVKPLVFIGLISYSLYLWHWGIIVYYKQYTLESPSLLFVFVSSFIMAALSWKFIEQPFRKTLNILVVYSSLAFLLIGLIIFGITVYFNKGIPKRLPDELHYMRINGINDLKNPFQKQCFIWGKEGILLNKIKEKSCRMGDKEQKDATFVLMGDSHSDAIFTGIDLVAKESKKKGVFFGHNGCNPIQGMFVKRPSQNCEEFKEEYYKQIYKDNNIKLVIFSARWASQLYGKTFDLGPAEPYKTPVENLLRLVVEPDIILSTKEREKHYFTLMENTIISLINRGKKVVIISSVPEVGYHVPRYLARKQFSSINTDLVNNKEYFYIRHYFILDFFSRLSKINGVTIIYPHEKLCANEGRACMYDIDNQPLYYDDDHLSVKGAEFIAPLLKSIF